MKKAQVMQDSAQYNDYALFKRGDTLIKKQLPEAPSQQVTQKFTVTRVDGQYSIYNQRILSIQINEDISSAGGTLVGFSYQKSKAKISQRYSKSVPDILSGDYAHRLRNQTSMKGYPINRIRYVEAPAKDQNELHNMINRAARDIDMKTTVKLTVYGFLDIELLDTVDVQIEQEGILSYMYVESITYNLASSNEITTDITMRPFTVYST